MGLYVYGALLMAMSFAAGAYLQNAIIMACALASCALAALSEVVGEVIRAKGKNLGVIQDVVAVASWGLTVGTVFLSVWQLILERML